MRNHMRIGRLDAVLVLRLAQARDERLIHAARGDGIGFERFEFDAGEILIPAELVQAAPHTRLKADREGDAVVLKPLAEKPAGRTHRIVDSLPRLEGRLAESAMTFRREDIYGPDGR